LKDVCAASNSSSKSAMVSQRVNYRVKACLRPEALRIHLQPTQQHEQQSRWRLINFLPIKNAAPPFFHDCARLPTQADAGRDRATSATDMVRSRPALISHHRVDSLFLVVQRANGTVVPDQKMIRHDFLASSSALESRATLTIRRHASVPHNFRCLFTILNSLHFRVGVIALSYGG
jgi:hypothetical protein